jgi:hypothetical protein
MTHKQDIELEELRHKNKMEQLKYERETYKISHQWKLEEMRIKNAEIRKHHMRKQAYGR